MTSQAQAALRGQGPTPGALTPAGSKPQSRGRKALLGHRAHLLRSPEEGAADAGQSTW